MRKLAFSAFALPLVVLACGVFSGEDPPAEEAPPDRSGENAEPPPAVSGKPIDGVYVSSSKGSDDGDGSYLRPLKSLNAAFALAQVKQLRVLACAEDYTENITLVDGVSAYGDHDCAQDLWPRGEKRAVVRAPKSPAMVATKIQKPTRLDGFEIVAPDLDTAPAPTPAEASSIGGEIRDSKGLILSKVTIRAGKGAPGVDGVDPPASDQVQGGTPNGKVGQAQFACPPSPYFGLTCAQITKTVGAAGGTRTCSIGGNGGPGGAGGDGRYFLNGTKVNDPTLISGDGLVEQGRPLAATAETAKGGLASGTGTNGNPGLPGDLGANGAWSLSAEGFIPGDGVAGGPGKPGQGGGGGGGAECWQAAVGACSTQPPSGNYGSVSGGGGGAGGCGGIPGTAGTGGGASIALFLVASPITLEEVTLVSSTGGRGGKGAMGVVGFPGGGGGPAAQFGGAGGNGGRGGHAGLSGHGAPGPSIALAYTGAALTRTGVKLEPGEGGPGAPKLEREGQVIPATVGESLAEHAF